MWEVTIINLIQPPQAPQAGLLVRLDAWLMEQPEWPTLFLANRDLRRETARLVAKHLFTLPSGGNVGMNRGTARQFRSLVRKQNAKVTTKLGRRAQRNRNDALRARTRYGRMSAKRLEQLAAAAIAKQMLEEAELEKAKAESLELEEEIRAARESGETAAPTPDEGVLLTEEDALLP
jgi:hypothetical protein